MSSKKDWKAIYDAVDVAFENSFIFTELGTDHIDILVRQLGWVKQETDYTVNIIAKWDPPNYRTLGKIKINKDTGKSKITWGKRKKVKLPPKMKITFSSIDYGMWQVNDQHKDQLYDVNYLYGAGFIPYKIKRFRSMKDLVDIRTNSVARCFIETVRKEHGLPYKHDKSKAFLGMIHKAIRNLEKQGLYDKKIVQRYYNLIPTKQWKGYKKKKRK